MEKLPISVVVIARNEAHNIERCLSSVLGWVAEIVVLLNDCTDNTETLAKNFGASVFHDTWHGFRDQKNIALSHATRPWVLSLDADEVVSEALRSAIVNFIRNDDPQYAGARFARKVWFIDRWITHGDWYPDYSLRLFRRSAGRWVGSKTDHEKLQLDGPCATLKGDLYHYSNPTFNSQIAKINIFSDLFLARQIAQRKRFSATRAVGRAFWRFFRAYILKRGFLDGFLGFYIACLNAFSTLVRHSRLYEYERNPVLRRQFSSDDHRQNVQ